MRSLRGLLLFVSLLFSFAAYAADCGKVPFNFYVISQDTLFGSVGIIPASQLDAKRTKLLANATSNIEWMRQETGNRIDFCMGTFTLVGISDMQDFAPFAVDKEFWAQVEKAAANGTLTPALRTRARNEVTRICGLIKLITAEFADYLGGGPVGYPLENVPQSPPTISQPRPFEVGVQRQSKELPIKVIIDECYTFGRSLGLKDSTSGLARSDSFIDLMIHITEIAVEPFSQTAVGKTLFSDFSVVEARKNEASFMRDFRRGIHIQLLERRDDTLLHEVGHYLGLPHVQSFLPVPCADSDNPPVADTPGMPNSKRDDYGNYAKAPRSKWPQSCAPVRDPAGSIVDDKYPLDNYMLSGSTGGFTLRFTDGQLKVMERMVDMLVR